MTSPPAMALSAPRRVLPLASALVYSSNRCSSISTPFPCRSSACPRCRRRHESGSGSPAQFAVRPGASLTQVSPRWVDRSENAGSIGLPPRRHNGYGPWRCGRGENGSRALSTGRTGRRGELATDSTSGEGQGWQGPVRNREDYSRACSLPRAFLRAIRLIAGRSRGPSRG